MRLSFIIICTLLCKFAACIDYDGWINIKVQHTLSCENEKYCTRGNISFKSVRAGTPIIDQIPLNNRHLKELQEIADVDGFYTLKTIVTAADSKQTEFLSSVKAQSFLESGLTDVINAWVLPNGEVIAVGFQVGTPLERNVSQETDGEYRIKSNIYLRHIDLAPVPDTASYIQKLEREREAREKGELKDNRSFLVKYWMYIVPIAIFVMISGATAPDAPAQNAR